MRRVLVRLRLEGTENLPPEGPAIIAANHLSFFDSVLLLYALPRRVPVLGKAEYTDRRITRWLFWVRDDPRPPPAARRPGHSVGSGATRPRGWAVLAVFPEGTRSRDGQLIGHCGAAHLGC